MSKLLGLDIPRKKEVGDEKRGGWEGHGNEIHDFINTAFGRVDSMSNSDKDRSPVEWLNQAVRIVHLIAKPPYICASCLAALDKFW